MATPEELALFQQKLEGNVPNTGTAPATGLGLYDRLAQSGVRLASNPAVQAVGGLPLAAASQMAGLGGTRDTTSFQRELEGQPQHIDLKPMASGPELTMPTTPTLAPGYGRTPQGMGGGGGGMGQLKADYLQAQRNQFGTFDQERDLVERRGELQGERIDATANLQELNAARKQRDVEVMQKHQAEVQAKHDAFLARNQQLTDEIGAEQIDPAKVMGSKTSGQKVAMMIAGLLNGANGSGPQYLARIDNEISEGVRAQMANEDGKKSKLAARQSLFGQMMAESGDRRVAEAQTKNLMWEAVKQKMAADEARLGIPEVTNNAQLNMNAIEQSKQNPLRVQLTGEALRAAQAQAAAAAAAQRHAEEQAWTRSMQVAEMGLKQDAQKIEMAKLAGKETDDINAETSKLGNALADPKLASGRAAVENSKRRLGINEDGTVKLDKDGKPVVDQSEGLPGVGPTADLRDKVGAKPTGLAVADPWAWARYKALGLNNEERVSRGDLEKMALAYQNQVTGAGGSVEEQAKIRKAFLGANTPAEQRAAVAEADAVFRQVESRHKAGVSPRALKTFEDRLNGVSPSMPDSVRMRK